MMPGGKISLIGTMLLFACGLGRAQLVDSFTDGDFTSNPAWTGDTGQWIIVQHSDVSAGATNSQTLRLDAASGSGIAYLSTQRTEPWGVAQTWGFWMGRRNQPASNFNRSIVWLWASEQDLNSPTINGYRIIFGDNVSTGDKIKLERVQNGVGTVILRSTNAVPNGLKDYGMLVRITRDVFSNWSMYTSVFPANSGEGPVATQVPSKANTPVFQGSVSDATFTVFDNGYFGFMAKYSQSADARAGAEFDQLHFVPEYDHPIPVELLYFQGSFEDEKVILTWATASETENAGFHIYRSQRKEGPFIRLTATLIQGAGNSQRERYYQWTDERVEGGVTYYYKLIDIDFNGARTPHGPIAVFVPRISASVQLMQNYPNPFNPGTTIRFHLPRSEEVELSVFNSTGRRLRTLISGRLHAGRHQISWDGTDDGGRKAASGLYIYRLKTQTQIINKTMILKR